MAQVFIFMGWSLLAGGMVVAAMVGWLASRRSRAVRILGRTLAAVAIPCAWVIFMLIADNGVNPRDLRLAGSLVILFCTLVIGLALGASRRRPVNAGTT